MSFSYSIGNNDLNRGLQLAFKKADKNRDGVLDQNELKKAVEFTKSKDFKKDFKSVEDRIAVREYLRSLEANYEKESQRDGKAGISKADLSAGLNGITKFEGTVNYYRTEKQERAMLAQYKNNDALQGKIDKLLDSVENPEKKEKLRALLEAMKNTDLKSPEGKKLLEEANNLAGDDPKIKRAIHLAKIQSTNNSIEKATDALAKAEPGSDEAAKLQDQIQELKNERKEMIKEDRDLVHGLRSDRATDEKKAARTAALDKLLEGKENKEALKARLAVLARMRDPNSEQGKQIISEMKDLGLTGDDLKKAVNIALQQNLQNKLDKLNAKLESLDPDSKAAKKLNKLIGKLEKQMEKLEANPTETEVDLKDYLRPKKTKKRDRNHGADGPEASDRSKKKKRKDKDNETIISTGGGTVIIEE